MRTFLPFVFETSTLFLLLFIGVTNVIFPLMVDDLPLFWMFTKRGRNAVDKWFSTYFPNQTQPKKKEKTSEQPNRETQDSEEAGGRRGGVRPADAPHPQ